MGMFENDEIVGQIESTISDPEPENNFIPAGDEYLEDYLKEIEEPKQDQEAPIIPDDSDYEDEESEQPQKPPYSNYQLQTSQNTAFTLVKTFDDILSSSIAYYALEKNVEPFKASKEELQEISKHLAVYFAENSFNLPPWSLAAINGSIVISKKFNMAGQLRKANLETRKAEAEVKELKREIDRLNKEKELENLRKEVEHLKDGQDN